MACAETPAAASAAVPASSQPAPDAFGMAEAALTSLPAEGRAGDELLMYQEFPVVVSASRQAQPLNLSSVPVSIVSAEDIHYSARTTIPEILQFVPGMDVQRIDRNTYAVGVRGLHHSLADRTLTLLNGRNASSPSFGGVDYLAIPVMLEDIERIEVVRGPGGAAWGANAFNGVINIITKKPEEVQGILTTSSVDNYGDTYNELRWAETRASWAWRLSVGYENRQSSEHAWGSHAPIAVADPTMARAMQGLTLEANDYSSNSRFDGEADYRFADGSRLSFGLAGAYSRRGTQEIAGTITSDDSTLDGLRAFARLDSAPNPESSGYLQWFSNYEVVDYLSVGLSHAVEDDLEGQWTVQQDAHKLTLGGNVRVAYVDLDTPRSTDVIEGTATEYSTGLFVMDRWQLTKRLALEGQIRGDWYSPIGPDWSGRMGLLYGVDEANRHVLRLAAARAFRSPTLAIRTFGGQQGPLPPPAPPGLYAFNFLRNPDLQNEHVTALELGYTGQLTDNLTLRIDGYYQRYQDLIGGAELEDPLGFGRKFVQLRNVDGADAPGAETELAYADRTRRLSLWYAFNDFYPDEENQSVRGFLPVRHQAGINGRWMIGDGWTVSGNYKFLDMPNSAANQLDLLVAKSLFDKRAEIACGVADVFDASAHPLAQEGQLTTHDTPGRTFFVRLQIKW